MLEVLDFGDRPARVLYCLGFRAQESTGRRLRPVLARNERASTRTRDVWDWLPIHGWTEAEVWQRHRDVGLPWHPAYDEGMTRLSCSFCIMSSRADLRTAARLRPDLAAEYLAVEEELGMPFQAGRSLASVLADDPQPTLDAGLFSDSELAVFAAAAGAASR